MMTGMKPVERVLKTIKHGEPDRVPIFELMIDPHIIQKILPGASYADLVEALDIDCVVCPTPSSMYGKEILGNKDGLPIFKTECVVTRVTTA